MAQGIDRDPVQCELRIQKRREFLIQQYEENKQELLNPALIVEEQPITGECQELMCLLKPENKEQNKSKIVTKILLMTISVLIIVGATLLAILIGKMGN
ncbi:hypothetical protein [Mycoplasmopsis lipofaciens]|uniref:hypothetical protein n=1 Tax=Mycoplasmopsis lipofaciens TaxID=114884 RepID=UPI000488C297|nr:hypothetical protein [Mycoplasmopsis lipofaciens]